MYGSGFLFIWKLPPENHGRHRMAAIQGPFTCVSWQTQDGCSGDWWELPSTCISWQTQDGCSLGTDRGNTACNGHLNFSQSWKNPSEAGTQIMNRWCLWGDIGIKTKPSYPGVARTRLVTYWAPLMSLSRVLIISSKCYWPSWVDSLWKLTPRMPSSPLQVST